MAGYVQLIITTSCPIAKRLLLLLKVNVSSALAVNTSGPLTYTILNAVSDSMHH